MDTDEDDYSWNANTKKLVGRTVTGIWMDEQHLKFATDQGDIAYCVDGDCCSSSYFYDFIGVAKLLAGNPIVSVKEIELSEDGPAHPALEPRYQESVAVYGYEFVTEDPNLGDVTSVMSFRNDSNGYYGGSLQNADAESVPATVPQLTEDCLATDPLDPENLYRSWSGD